METFLDQELLALQLFLLSLDGHLGGLRRPSRYTKRMPSSDGWLIVCSVNQALKDRLLSTVLLSDRHDNVSIISPCLFLLSNFTTAVYIPTRISNLLPLKSSRLYLSAFLRPLVLS